MKFAAVFLSALLPLAALAKRSSPYVPLHKRQTPGQNESGEVYETDLFEGLRNKQETSRQNASELQYTEANGSPWHAPMAAQRAGARGPLLLQDSHLINVLARFNRERIPERVVHARGAGAHGYFEATTDFASSLSVADVFRQGQRTSVTVRFSTVGGPRGSADLERDPRGFSVKFRTNEGILDWVFNNAEMFFIRDPAKFPLFIHTQKDDPATNTRDWNTFWSWPAQNPEAWLMFLRLFSDLGTPRGFRFMDGWSGHTYRLVQDDGSWVFVRVKLESDQGIRNFTSAEAAEIRGENAAWSTQDLYDAIDQGEYPSWTVRMATMTEEEAEDYMFDVEDLTKHWLNVTWNEVGVIKLTQNPENFFAEIEQSHFSPSHMVPGWEPSFDPVLQSRLFSYPDAARYRLGANFHDIPVNCPFSNVANFDRDGHMMVSGNQGSRPNFPDEFEDELPLPEPSAIPEIALNGSTVWVQSVLDADIDYFQPRWFYNDELQQGDRDNLHGNIAETLVNVDNDELLDKLMEEFETIDPALRAGVEAALAEAQQEGDDVPETGDEPSDA